MATAGSMADLQLPLKLDDDDDDGDVGSSWIDTDTFSALDPKVQYS
jgi:hypothetical protein